MNLDLITQYKTDIDTYLLDFLRAKRAKSIATLQTDALNKLETFVVSGKTIRGSLMLFTASAFGYSDSSKTLPIAAAIELAHSAFLIQDDIMDKDELRRSNPTVHIQYAQAAQSGIQANHYGTSMAINVADLCLFYAYELLATAPQDTLSLFSQELALVTTGQMSDVSASLGGNRLSEDEIFTIYKHKTARYTFSLPMMIGAQVASADSNTIIKLGKLGESIGLIFQIHDDELNIMGDENLTGKTAGSDLENNKQTIVIFYLQKEHDLQKLQAMPTNMQRQVYQSSTAKKQLESLMNTLYAESVEQISTLPFDTQHKEALVAVADFVKTRKN